MVTVREPYELSIREASDLIKRVFLSGYRLWGAPFAEDKLFAVAWWW